MRRIDDLQNGFKIIQNTDEFCFGTDAVMLADFAKIKKGEKVIDICSGNGIIPILLVAKYSPSFVTAFEIQKGAARLACDNMEYNNISNKVNVICDDIKNAHKYIEKPVDAVTCNPPYMPWGGALVNESDVKTIARHEIYCKLDDIFKCVSKVLKFGGRFYMVHKASRLSDIIETGHKYNLEPKQVQFIYGNIEKCAKLILISFVLGGGAEMKILPPIIL